MFCPTCGKDVPPGAQFCQGCGSPLPSQGPQAGAPTAAVTSDLASRFAHLSEYWQNVFAKFNRDPTQMQTHWNWPAFFFGPFWYLAKGMPAKGLLYVVIAVTGIGWLFLIVYAGLYGAWDYYLKEAKGKQLW